MTEEAKRTVQDILDDEKKWLAKDSSLADHQKQLRQREERFFSNYGQSMSYIKQILDNYASVSARTFYQDLLDQMQRSHRAMTDYFEEEHATLKAEAQKIESQLSSLYEERLTLENQEAPEPSSETAETDDTRKENQDDKDDSRIVEHTGQHDYQPHV